MQFITRSWRRLLLLGVVGLLAAALAVPALAQSADDTEVPDTGETPSVEAEPGWEERVETMRSAFAEALAEELDLPVERVDEALTTVRDQMIEEHSERRLEGLQERLDAAVAAGELTQEQADAITEAADVGVLRDGALRGSGRHGRPGWHSGSLPGDDAMGAWDDDQA